MISEARGAVCTIESMCHPCKHFRWWFLSRQRLSFRWWFLRPQGLISLSNPCITRESSFGDDFWGHRCWLRCRIHTSPVVAVSLMSYESLGAVCAVESMYHPWNQFSRWFLRLEGLFTLSNSCVTCGSSFVDDFWGHRGCLRCRIHASRVEAVSLMIF
jgi:hypothetical protein